MNFGFEFNDLIDNLTPCLIPFDWENVDVFILIKSSGNASSYSSQSVVCHVILYSLGWLSWSHALEGIYQEQQQESKDGWESKPCYSQDKMTEKMMKTKLQEVMQ